MQQRVEALAPSVIAAGSMALVILALVVVVNLLLIPLSQATREDRLVVVILGAAALILSVIAAVRAARGRGADVGGVLTATAAWLPGTLAVTVVALFLLEQSVPVAIAVGAAVTVLAWLSVGLFFSRYASVERAQPRNHAELRDRYNRLSADYRVLCTDEYVDQLPDGEKTNARIARAELDELVKIIRADLDPAQPSSGRAWITGSGYINLWNRIHRAEEALIDLAPVPNVQASAGHDLLRLVGSKIGHSDELIKQLQDALQTLGNAGTSAEARANARRQLRNVREDINKYRDDVWDKMLDERNALLRVMIFTGLTANVALVLALVAGADKTVIVGASAFYLIGAIIGLFSRLRAEAKSTAAIKDYGLSEARLVVTPLISGLAAIAGVVLTAKIVLPATGVVAPASVDDSGKVVAPASEVAAPASLHDIFTIDLNPAGVVVAAVFGLTPGLVLDRLQNQADKYKADLQASSSTDSNPNGPGPTGPQPSDAKSNDSKPNRSKSNGSKERT